MSIIGTFSKHDGVLFRRLVLHAFLQFRLFIRHHANLSKISKIKERIIFESRDQCPGDSRVFVSILWALIRAYKIFPEIRNFLDNSGRFSDSTTNLMKLRKHKSLQYLIQVTSANDAQEPLSMPFQNWLIPRKIFQKFFIL